MSTARRRKVAGAHVGSGEAGAGGTETRDLAANAPKGVRSRPSGTKRSEVKRLAGSSTHSALAPAESRAYARAMPNPGHVLDGTTLETRNLPRLQAKLGIGALLSRLPTGGLTGQQLTKTSDTDFDVGWTSAPVGGITELTGDVTAGPGSGSQVATIPALSITSSKLAADAVTTTKLLDDAVTYAKMQNVSVTDRLLGRDSAGAGNAEELTVGGGLEFSGAGGIRTAAFTGDVTKAAGGTAQTIANDAVTNAKLANMAATTIKGNATGGSADPADLTGAQVAALLPVFTSSLKGLVPPATGGGTINFLRADGTFAAPPDTTGITQLTGDVFAGPGSGSQVATIQNDAVTTSKILNDAVTAAKIPDDAITNAKLANMSQLTIKGNNTVFPADPIDLTVAQATAMLNTFSSLLAGLVPASGGGSANFLRADGTFNVPPGTGITQLTGDVTAGPGSGSQVGSISNDAVNNAKLADMPTLTLKGNNTGGTASPLDLTVAQVNAMLNVWPIGSIFISVVSTNPNTLLGYGTWVAFGAGRMIVGLDAGDPDFDTAQETGGAKTHTLTTPEIPSHTHVQDSHNHTQNSHNHTQDSHNHTQDAHNHTQDSHNHTQNSHTHGFTDLRGLATGVATTNRAVTEAADTSSTATGLLTAATTATNVAATATNQAATATNQATTATNQAATATNIATTATNQNTGGGGAHSVLNPYIVCYLWRRTA